MSRDAIKVTQHGKDNTPRLKELLRQKRGVAQNLKGGGSHMEIFWDFSDKAKEEAVCHIRIGNEEGYFSADQLMKILRAV